MTFFLRDGNTFRVTSERAMDLHRELPAGNYVIKEDQFGNLYLEEVETFEPLSKYYGDTVRNVQRIFNTFMDRPNTTGVMLTGEKGSGKTLLAKELAIRGYASGMPTLVINQPWCGDKFNKFIQSIEQPMVILFDEFEKVYNSDKQEHILTLLDGVFPTKKLFVITCNDKWRVDSHMRNRPGRIFYSIDFRGLTVEFVEEYCNENLINKTHIPQVKNVASLFTQFNFDMLKALVEDMNRYDETPQEALALLNITPEYDTRSAGDTVFRVYLTTPDGHKIEEQDLYTTKWERNPLSTPRIIIETSLTNGDDDDDVISYNFSQTDLTRVDGASGTFEYVSPEGAKLRLVREKPQCFDYFGAI